MDNTTIRSRDGTSLHLQIPYRFYNAETPLIFNGKNINNYGRVLNQNLLNLLSNFANDEADSGSIDGQLWFDSKNDRLLLKDGTTFKEVGYTRPPLVPSDAVKDYELNILLSDVLSKDGGTVSGTLLTKVVEETDSENSVVNKQYVDNLKPPIPKLYIPLSGNKTIPEGKIYVAPKEFKDPLQIVTKKYVDDTTPQIKYIIEDGKISKTGSNTLKGWSNIIEYAPFNLIYIFGESYLPIDNITTTIHFDKLGNIKSSQVQVSIIDNLNKDVTVDAKFVVNDGKGELVIIRHNSSIPEAVTVHYIITGVKA
jgi:hypothetical protein